MKKLSILSLVKKQIILIAIAISASTVSYSQVLITFTEINGGADMLMSWSGQFTHNVLTSPTGNTGIGWGIMSTTDAMMVSGSYTYDDVAFSSDAGVLDSQNVYGYNGGNIDTLNTTGVSFGVQTNSRIVWSSNNSMNTTTGSMTLSGLSVSDLYASSWSADSLDQFSVHFTAVPEPSTYAAIFGALSLGFVIYRKKK